MLTKGNVEIGLAAGRARVEDVKARHLRRRRRDRQECEEGGGECLGSKWSGHANILCISCTCGLV